MGHAIHLDPPPPADSPSLYRPPPARRLSGVFPIAGRAVRISLNYQPSPRPDARWWRLWQELTAGCGYRHVQQAGQRQTYLAVAADDAATGRAFTQELICGGWFWTRLQRRHHCFLVRGNRVEVFTGPRLRADRALAQVAGAVVLPLARAEQTRREAATARRDAAWAVLRRSPWKACLAEYCGEKPPAAFAMHVAEGAALIVGGELEQSEAEALVEDLSGTGAWQPRQHGRTVVWCGARELLVDGAGESPVTNLRSRVAGFCEWVVVSDLHLGLPPRDSFGRAKAEALCALLDRVIRRRSVLVLNGDFLELLHERYGVIKRAYPEIFARLARVRRIVYVAGNHDADVLRDRIKQTRRTVRAVARRHTYAEVRLGLDGECWLERTPRAHHLRHRRAWSRLLQDARVHAALVELLQHRHGRVFLSHGFAAEGVAFQRLGPRDTPREQPQWYLDESVALRRDAPTRLLKLLADRRQRLDRVLQADWGGRVEIVRHLWLPARGLYFEHGHAAIPACGPGGIGWLVSTAAGWLKRCGLRRIEHWFEEDLGGLLHALHPFGKVRETTRIASRLLAVASWLRTAHPGAPAPLLICGHTHEPAHVGEGPVHALLQTALGAAYGNCGAWSSRLRRAGAHRGEWLVIAADNSARVHFTDVGVTPQPESETVAASPSVGQALWTAAETMEMSG